MPKRVLKGITAFALPVLTAGCAGSTAAEKTIPYRYASMEEGEEIFLANTAYFDGCSQNDLDFKMQKKDAVLDEYKAFGAEQVQEFSEEEKKVMDEYFSYMEKVLKDNGYTLPLRLRTLMRFSERIPIMSLIRKNAWQITSL